MEFVDRVDRVCVLGAGSSGLAAAKNLKEQGFAVDILEREDDLGGNWNYCKPNARVYRSTRMISSKRFTQYPDFKFPRHYPDYPHHAQVLERNDDGLITTARLFRPYEAPYGRVEVLDANGEKAWSNPLWTA